MSVGLPCTILSLQLSCQDFSEGLLSMIALWGCDYSKLYCSPVVRSSSVWDLALGGHRLGKESRDSFKHEGKREKRRETNKM